MKFINIGFVSSSEQNISDPFLSLMGGYYYPETGASDDGGVDNTSLNFQLPNEPIDDDALKLLGGETTATTSGEYDNNEWISAVFQGTADMIQTTSSVSMFPSYVIPYTIHAAGDSGIVDSEHWRAIVMGTPFHTSSYKGIITEGDFEVTSFADEKVGYEWPELLVMDPTNSSDYELIDSKTVYNHFYPYYQQYASRTSIHELPNAHDLVTTSLEVTRNFKEEIRKHLFIDYEITDLTDISGFTYNVYPAMDLSTKVETYIHASPDRPDTIKYEDKYFNSRDYYEKFSNSVHSQSNVMPGLSRVLYINKEHFQDLDTNMQGLLPHIPYYCKIGLPKDPTTELEESEDVTPEQDIINDLIDTNDLGPLLLSTIASEFVFNRDMLEEQTYKFQIDGLRAPSNGASGTVSYNTTGSLSFKQMDLVHVLMEYGNNPKARTSIGHFIGSGDPLDYAALDTSGITRYINKGIAHDSLKYLIDNTFLDGGAATAQLPWIGEEYTEFVESSDITSERPANAGVVGYRINKVDLVTGEEQDIIIRNPPSTYTARAYYDSQVRYGNTYAYTTYAYYAVIGYKYRYQNLALSRTIGEGKLTDITEDDVVFAGASPDGVADDTFNAACIEFYSPFSGETVSPAMSGDEELEFLRVKLTDIATSGYATDAQELAFTGYDSGTRSEVYSPFYADFNMVLEPIIKIIEVPMHNRSLTVLDHPPTQPSVTPFQVKNNSQKIGFHLRVETFTTEVHKFPSVFTSENFLATRYLDSFSKTSELMIDEQSRSKPIKMMIYRLSEKPNSIEDFSNALVATKDLIISGINNSSECTTVTSNCFYEEVIATNHKFYYIFRIMNENNIPGPWSNIYISELIDDGGYKYALFNTINIEELSDTIAYDHPSTPFKKIFKLKPNLSQINFDLSNVNYDDTAESQVSDIIVGNQANDLIWDKKYKIRLTSKKTGRKIDLNVTYKLKEEIDGSSV